ncbi:putative transmembrane protein [Apostichopus japonicus]|uniref:Putative transmembrane protein n=1 Tax=Stichopus japonicus TaxID=307972 RepID=A0A2G8LR81_STIJA|nr:putative transmembrane protein [Apostichopus japonicus]
MAAINWLLSFIETLLLAAGGLCGLIVAICVGISKNGFDGNCILFSTFEYCNATAGDFTYLGKPGSCHFVILSEVLVAFYVLLYALYHACYLAEKMKEYHRLMLPAVVISIISLVAVFVSACLLSIGFKRFCGSLNGREEFGVKLACSAVPKWNLHPKCGKDFLPHKDFTSGNYYSLMTTAQGAAWFGFLFLLVALISLILRRIMYKPAVGDPSSSDKAQITSNMVL